MASEADRTYSVTWSRPDGTVQTCTSLTPRVAFARLWSAWKADGEITVIDVAPEWITDDSLITANWPYPIPPPVCEDATVEGWTCVVSDVAGFWCAPCTLWGEENSALISSAQPGG